MIPETRTPYRIAVFAHGWRVTKRLKKVTRIEPMGYAYMGWSSDQAYSEARLPSAGSFLYPGLHAVRAAALIELAKLNVYQVQVRTNQDRKRYVFSKRSDGVIGGYGYGRNEGEW